MGSTSVLLLPAMTMGTARPLGSLHRSFFHRKSSTFPGSGKPGYFVTTPIFYVNASPHIGHLYSAVLADASHRFRMMLGATNTIFATGTDEHGMKIQQAASNDGEPVRSFCGRISSQYIALFRKASIEHTDFIRTTEDRHVEAVQSFWRALVATGDIYQGKYEGWYCVADETFVPELQLKDVVGKDGKLQKVSEESNHPVEWTTETNYMFRLSKYRDDLLHWLRISDVVQPRKFAELLRRTVEEGLPDLSVSRSSSRLSWGIRVPGDDTQTIYVWLDALINYLTVAGYPRHDACWPPDVQVIGKDILKFHGIYWPAFLMAVGLEPPRKLVCHSHWTVDNEKMSKSKGNVVDPMPLMATTSPDAVRYFLLREGVPHSDGNFSDAKLITLVNAELGDTLGNLLSRCTAKSLNPNQRFPSFDRESFNAVFHNSADELIQSVTALPELVKASYLEFNFYRGLEQVMACLRLANTFFQDSRPWELSKTPDGDYQVAPLDSALYAVLETLRVAGLMLLPVTPTLASDLLDRLGIRRSRRSWAVLTDSFGGGKRDGWSLGTASSGKVLFRKIKD